MIGIEDAEDGPVILEKVGEEADCFLVHVAAQGGEGGEVAVTFFIQLVEPPEVQPLAGELGGQGAGMRGGEQAAGFRFQGGWKRQRAGGGVALQGGVRGGGPQEIAESAG